MVGNVMSCSETYLYDELNTDPFMSVIAIQDMHITSRLAKQVILSYDLVVSKHHKFNWCKMRRP